MTDATELDEAGIRETWLRQCGPCDAGLPMACVCSDADPRPVIGLLLTALDEARAEADELRRDLYPALDRAEARAQAAESALAAVEALAKVQAISCRAQHRSDHERNWLDVLAIIERAALATTTTPEETQP